LGNPRTFHYLNQSNCYELDGVDDSKEYLATRKAMDVVGIGFDEQVVFLISFGETSFCPHELQRVGTFPP
jgi:myosin heavy subunit